MEHKLTLGQLKSIGRANADNVLLAFYESLVSDWDSVTGITAMGVRVSERLWQWILARMRNGAETADAKIALGFMMVNMGPGSDSDLTGATVRVQDNAITY